MEKLFNGLKKAEEILLVVLMVIMCAVIFIATVARFTGLFVIPWAEELARYLFVWMAYLGGGYALHTGGQIEIDIAPTIIRSLKGISTAAKDRVILLLKTAGMVITVVFLLGFCRVFGDYVLFIAGGSQTSQTMHIPMWIVYFPVLIGSFITVWHGAYRILCNIRQISVNAN